MYPPSSPQSAGQVLDAAFRIFQATLVKALPHGVLAMIAGQLQNIYLLAIGKPLRSFGDGDPLWWALYLAGVFLSLVLCTAMLARQHRIVTGRGADLRAEMSEVLHRSPSLVGAMLLAIVAILLGLIALVIPGVYLMTALSLAWPVWLIEGRGPVGALRRSAELVKGSWWRATTVLAMATVTALVFYFVVFALLAIALPLAGANDIAMFTAALVVVLVALGAVGVPFFGAILLALHAELRLRREGSDLASRLAGAATA